MPCMHCLTAGSGEVWAAGSNNDGQLGLGQDFGIKNADFRLVRALQGGQQLLLQLQE